MDADPRYWAFLSYSHSDARWARWLHHALESFRTPARFVGQPTAAGPAPARFRPVFRDRAELAADPNLGERIRHCLEHSGFLVVLCSPAAAASPWVEQEIATFKALHGEHRVFAAIVSGEPFSRTPGQECFPRALRYRVEADGRIGEQRAEPVAADLRPHGDGKRLARLKLLAGMLSIGLDDLVRREHQVRHRRLTILAGASTAGVLVMAGLTLEAVRARNAAEAQRVQAEGLVEFMLTDLRKKLEPAGRLDALDAVGRRLLAYYAAEHGHTADSLGRRARVLHLLGSIRAQRGDLSSAQQAFGQAADSTGKLLARAPNDPPRLYDHSQSLYWMGYAAWRRGDTATAERAFTEYERLVERLVRLAPRNAAWRAEQGYAASNLGTLELEQGEANAAAAAFSRALAISQQLAAQSPEDHDLAMDLAQSHAWMADADAALGRLDMAAAGRSTERRLLEAILREAPDDNAAAVELCVSRAATGKLLLRQSRIDEAVAETAAAASSADRIVAEAPGNVENLTLVAPAYLTAARALLQARRLGPAAQMAARAEHIMSLVVRRDPLSFAARRRSLAAARLVRMEIAERGAVDGPTRQRALQGAASEEAAMSVLVRQHPRHVDMRKTELAAKILTGDYRLAIGDAAGARAIWADAAARQSPPEDPLEASVVEAANCRLKTITLRPRTGVAETAVFRKCNIGWY